MLPRFLATRPLASLQSLGGPNSAATAAAAAAAAAALAPGRLPRARFRCCSHGRGPIATRAAGDLDDEAEASQPPPHRRHRRLFGSQQQQQQQQQQHGVQKHAPAEQPAAQDQQHRKEPGEQQSPDEQQKCHQWWPHPAAAQTLQVFGYWDLDNLQPQQWSHMTPLVGALKAALRPFGCLRRITAYANTTTLTACEFVADQEELRQEVEAAELRCDICGNRFTSLAKLQKHFKQLHEREHNKRLQVPKKAAQHKYAQSEKAQRMRAAACLYSTPLRNRSGNAGQMVKILLQQQQVSCFEVPPKRQAADEAIRRHIKQLQQELSSKAADELPELPELPVMSRKQQQKQLEARHEAAAALQAATGPWHGLTNTALERAVLVIVSDDRGFAAAIAEHLAAGGAGAVLVTSRSAADWLPVMQRASCQAASDSRLGDVVLVPWGLLLPEEEQQLMLGMEGEGW